MVPRVVHQFWDRPAPPGALAERMESWRLLHPTSDHVPWDDVARALCLRAAHGGDAECRYRAYRLPNVRSLRLAAVSKFGGLCAPQSLSGKCAR